MENFIKNILDIPHAEGAALIGDTDTILVNAMPSYLEQLSFEDLGRRVRLLFESVDENFMPFEDTLLKFEAKWIYLRRFDSVTLVILCDPQVSLPSLKMVTNLARKSITPEWLESIAGKPAAVAAKAQEPTVDLTQDQPEKAEEKKEEAASKPPARGERPRRATRPRRAFRGTAY